MSSEFKDLLANRFKGIEKATGALSKLWRKILFDLNITAAQSEKLIYRYLRDARNGIASGSERSSARNNLSNELAKTDMTWKNLMRGMKLLRPTRARVVVYFTWPNGEVTEHEVEIDFYEPCDDEGADDVSN